MTTPSQTADIPSAPPGVAGRARAPFQRLLSFARQEPGWVLLFVAYLVAWYMPLMWCWEWWGNPRDPVSAQMWVPILTAVLAWSRREDYISVSRQTRGIFTNFWMRGNNIPVYIGCVALLLSHFTHIKSIAILSLLLIAVGAFYRLYGWPVIRAAWVPIVFSLLTVPPPDTLWTHLGNGSNAAGVRLTGAIYNLLGFHTTADPRGMLLYFGKGGYSVEFPYNLAPVNILLPTLTFVLFYILLRRTPIKQAGAILIIATVVSLAVSIVQDIIVAGAYGVNKSIGDALIQGKCVTQFDFQTTDGAFSFPAALHVLWFLFISWFWIFLAFGASLLATRALNAKAAGAAVAGRTGAVVNRVGGGINILISPLVALLNALGKIGVLFQRSERGIEKLFRRMGKRKRGW